MVTTNQSFERPASYTRIELLKQVEWRTSDGLTTYPEAIAFMEKRVSAIKHNTAPETVWFLEHPPIYTAGTSSRVKDLLQAERFPVYSTGRGGQYTYHGPGQRVAYVMLDLSNRGSDIRGYVRNLENWVIATLALFDICGKQGEGRVGIWVADKGGNEKKIAAIGVRIRRWVSFHGIAINVHPDLTHFDGIVPCGIFEYGVTSLHEIGKMISLREIDFALKKTFHDFF